MIPGPDTETPAASPDLACPGLGPVTGTRVRIAGLFGGGLHTATSDGWCLDVAAPEWPHHRVLLSADGGAFKGQPGQSWCLHVFNSDYSTFRAAGFSPFWPHPRRRYQQRPHSLDQAWRLR